MSSDADTRRAVITTVRLTNSKDWPAWFGTLKKRATILQVWDLVDPDQPNTARDQVIMPEPPNIDDYKPSDQLTRLNEEQKAEYKADREHYELVCESKSKLYKGLLQLQQLIDASVDHQYIKTTVKLDTIRKQLKFLSINLKPSDESLRLKLLAQYQLLCHTPYGRQAQQYFDEWQSIKADDVGQPLGSKIFPQGDSDAARDLTNALEPLFPIEASAHKRVNRKLTTSVQLTDETEDWRNFCRIEGIEKFNKKINTRVALVAAGESTLKGADKTTPASGSNTPSNTPNSLKKEENPKCLCGQLHYYSECNYLIPARPRPSGWVPNRELKASIQKKLKDDTNLKGKVERAIEYYNKSQNKASSHTNKSCATEEGDGDDAQAESFAYVFSVEPYKSGTLRRSVIYVTGSNIHVVNKYLNHRVTNRRPAQPGQGLQAGDHNYQVEEIVDVKIYPQYPGPKMVIITLTGALFIPEFQTNVVSSTLLTQKGLHYDTTDPDWMFCIRNNQRLRMVRFNCSIKGHRVLETFDTPYEDEAQNISKKAIEEDAAPAATFATKERSPLKKTADQWHKLMGHPSSQAVKRLATNTEGCVVTDTGSEPPIFKDCDVCMQSTAHSLISRTSETHREVAVDRERGHMPVVS